jgi:predicted nuclease with TOPRIM domain
MVLEKEFNTMAKAEPNLAEVNREPDPNTVRMMDAEHALAVLRSENDRLKRNAETAARNEEIHKKNYESLRRETLKLQEQLLAAQERVYELQDKLLSLREIVNSA